MLGPGRDGERVHSARSANASNPSGLANARGASPNRIRRLPIRRAVKESGALQLGSHPAESAAKISADCCHDGNGSHGYQGSDKPVFDRGDPGLVAD
jgi:hypothetical protein